jgi:hypothetical protein
MLNEQVTRLDLSITDDVEAMEDTDLCSSDAFQLILSSCRGLLDLSFGQSKLCLSREYSVGRLSPSCCSSILTKLDIYLENVTDCLLLLDGRFECLSTFIVVMSAIIPGSATVENTVSEHVSLLSPRFCCVS